jgi:hypothetical protein
LQVLELLGKPTLQMQLLEPLLEMQQVAVWVVWVVWAVAVDLAWVVWVQERLARLHLLRQLVVWVEAVAVAVAVVEVGVGQVVPVWVVWAPAQQALPHLLELVVLAALLVGMLTTIILLITWLLVGYLTSALTQLAA